MLGTQLNHGDDAVSRAAEARIQASLPEIAGLDEGADDAVRCAVLGSTTAQQYRCFVARHGSAFGEAEKPSGDTSGTTTHILSALILNKNVVPA